jgi:hypothetical protein
MTSISKRFAGRVTALPRTTVIAQRDAALKLSVGSAMVDLARYPCRPRGRFEPEPEGVRGAGLRDLAVMKLAAIARRGAQRDCRDPHAIRGHRHLAPRAAGDDYVAKSGVSVADLYHVLRAVGWFEDAESEAPCPKGSRSGDGRRSPSKSPSPEPRGSAPRTRQLRAPAGAWRTGPPSSSPRSTATGSGAPGSRFQLPRTSARHGPRARAPPLAGRVTAAVAVLATGWGLTLHRSESAPAGRCAEYHDALAESLPSDPPRPDALNALTPNTASRPVRGRFRPPTRTAKPRSWREKPPLRRSPRKAEWTATPIHATERRCSSAEFGSSELELPKMESDH